MRSSILLASNVCNPKWLTLNLNDYADVAVLEILCRGFSMSELNVFVGSDRSLLALVLAHVKHDITTYEKYTDTQRQDSRNAF